MQAVLVIEDDEGLNRGICFTLEKEGFQVHSAHSLADGWAVFQSNKLNLIILDLNLPDGDGLNFCKKIREISNIPIIMLTVRDLETDEVMGFETGADDYITKPFSLSVLKARVATRLKMYEEPKGSFMQAKGHWLCSNHIRLCKETMKVYREISGNHPKTVDGTMGTKDFAGDFNNLEEIELSITEYKILLLFMEHHGRVLLKEQILEAIWDVDSNFVNENTLPVNISRLRKKLEENPSKPELIKTVHGMGYIWKESML
ncbi:DNA-binding response regulator, OmpR family, contains REC and winged-helix (wHTH) domain [Anaerocolumna jejuensis DSM 15929]|uniref:Stage 0 sporulation protein A homolog n=1 Tax=Anaerocolumna jejuensis DSM 15929 TaxID=1121322 RepID=A0A1M6VNB4_9FIRM|nr:response regulator transcription factor [Anaerocolumna jejuensis]SHK83002.1 DNA-binding response regulator, OmpR family, contains REC and winged-helix (wHTH) domain [Anaerocolumna jejuensis DSM 15929]